jgi:hypothetical protein
MTRPLCNVGIDTYNHERLIEPAIVSVLERTPPMPSGKSSWWTTDRTTRRRRSCESLRGEAIVNTPTDAVRTFFSSGMDALVIGSHLVDK